MHIFKLFYISALVGFTAAQNSFDGPQTVTGKCGENPSQCQFNIGNLNGDCPTIDGNRQFRKVQVTSADAAANLASCSGKKFVAQCTFNYHCVVTN
ncbi:hypothetical protein LZ30DRAFT_732222 [Colletotrichum cereale]|nr:hypothetical protein LZ30DRAFT_732222 [Colletotrichum cereale]